jgi:hypothetical protein
MARARTIKPHFMRSRSMRAVSAMARLTFIQLWLVADDAGRLAAPPRLLAHQLYPGDREAADRLPGWLDELEGQHCIERYTVDRLAYLRIVNWQRHQKIYHPTPSRLPARPAGFKKESGEGRETLGRENEKPSGDKALTPPAQIPERFETAPETLGKNPGNPCAPGTSPAFTSDSRGEGFFRRAAAAAQRALGRPRPAHAVIPNVVRDP